MSYPLKISLAFLIPAMTFLIGAGVMSKISEHGNIERQLKDHGLRPLNQRIRGYSYHHAAAVWKVVCQVQNGHEIELRYLMYDLCFPFLYGTALVVGTCLACIASGCVFPSPALFSLIFVTIVADWVENAIHIRQFQRFVRGTKNQNEWLISVASVATQIKLIFFALSFASIILIGLMFGSE